MHGHGRVAVLKFALQTQTSHPFAARLTLRGLGMLVHYVYPYTPTTLFPLKVKEKDMKTPSDLYYCLKSPSSRPLQKGLTSNNARPLYLKRKYSQNFSTIHDTFAPYIISTTTSIEPGQFVDPLYGIILIPSTSSLLHPSSEV